MSDLFPDRELLRRLLHEYNEDPDRRSELEQEITQRFSRTMAILVIDSSGFTRQVRSGRIVPFLALLERLERLVRPIAERSHGLLLRVEADNLYYMFDEVSAAVECARRIRRSVEAANEILPRAEELWVAMGIGYGSLLMIDADDVYGNEMNLACKLGEDLAEAGDVLLTPDARAAAGDTGTYEERTYNISGIDLVAYRLTE
jgi:adenylate cyclase